jgi:chitin synthase
MLGQRKRWINGTWFALEYVLENRKRVNDSGHSNWDKFKFRCNMFYSAFNKYVSYIGISLFFIIMHFMIQQYAQNQFLAQI